MASYLLLAAFGAVLSIFCIWGLRSNTYLDQISRSIISLRRRPVTVDVLAQRRHDMKVALVGGLVLAAFMLVAGIAAAFRG